MGCIAGLRVLDSYEKKITRYYKEITEEITELMNSSTIIKFSKPDSAFYIFVDISRTLLNDTEFCELLLNQKYTAATPGSSFGKQFNSYVRIALCGSMKDVKEGVHRFMELAEECAMKKDRA